MTGEVELRVHDTRAVLVPAVPDGIDSGADTRPDHSPDTGAVARAGVAGTGTPGPAGSEADEPGPEAGEPDPDVLGGELTEALHEWARVAAAVARTPGGTGTDMVSRRGVQLAGRVAAVLRQPVRYRDPVRGTAHRVPPRTGAGPAGAHAARRDDGGGDDGGGGGGPGTPWATGLTVSLFFAVVAFVTMVALARSLAAEAAGWVAVAAAALLTSGVTPSLWLGRRIAVVRWIVLGTAAGLALAWPGVLLIAFG